MVRRIDFFGAPGAGKSVLFKNTLKDKEYLSEGDALFSAARKYMEDFNLPTSLALKTTLFIPEIKKWLLNTIINKESKALLKQSVDEHTDFFKVAENTFSDRKNSLGHSKIQGFISFLEKMKKWQFINQYFNKSQIILSDESISQKIYGINGIRRMEEKDLKYVINYFKTMPLPIGVIHVYSEIPTIIKNLENRKIEDGKVIPAHRNITKNELIEKTEYALAISQLGVKTLRNRNVPILDLDTNHTIPENAQRIMEFIKTIHP